MSRPSISQCAGLFALILASCSDVSRDTRSGPSDGPQDPSTTQGSTQDVEKASGESGSQGRGSNYGTNSEARLRDLQDKAMMISEAKCVKCHSLTRADGGFGSADDVEAMIESGTLIVPGKPEESLFYTRLKPTSDMPPDDDLLDEDTQTIKDWIVALAEAVDQKVEPFEDSELVDLVAKEIASAPEGEAKDIRYFSLQELNNGGVKYEDLEIYRQAFAKVLNSLSNAPEVYQPEALGERRLLFAVNLKKKLGLSTGLFDSLISEHYPFGREYLAGVTKADLATERSKIADIKEAAGTKHFVVRVDWFLATALTPKIYARLLRLPKADGNIEELESTLGVDVAKNIEDGKVMRSGFKDSGVASNNRMIERHAGKDGRHYWRSYDFSSDSGQGNIFKNPLTPLDLPGDTRSDHIRMKPDGGESIFELPNGFLGFMLRKSDGTPAEKGPISVVKNSYGPPNLSGSVVNPVSCFSCHAFGILGKNDLIRDFSSQRTDLSESVSEFINTVYVDSKDLSKQAREDSSRYVKAQEAAGIDVSAPDPVTPAYIMYQNRLSKKRVAAELSTTEEKLEQLLKREPYKYQWSGLLVENASIKRVTFNELYSQALKSLGGPVDGGDELLPLIGDITYPPKKAKGGGGAY